MTAHTIYQNKIDRDTAMSIIDLKEGAIDAFLDGGPLFCNHADERPVSYTVQSVNGLIKNSLTRIPKDSKDHPQAEFTIYFDGVTRFVNSHYPHMLIASGLRHFLIEVEAKSIISYWSVPGSPNKAIVKVFTYVVPSFYLGNYLNHYFASHEKIIGSFFRSVCYMADRESVQLLDSDGISFIESGSMLDKHYIVKSISDKYPDENDYSWAWNRIEPVSMLFHQIADRVLGISDATILGCTRVVYGSVFEYYRYEFEPIHYSGKNKELISAFGDDISRVLTYLSLINIYREEDSYV